MSGLGLAIPADLLAIALLAYGTYFRRYHRRDLLLAYVAGIAGPGRTLPFFGRPGRKVTLKILSGGTTGGASMKRQSDSDGTLSCEPILRPSSITV